MLAAKFPQDSVWFCLSKRFLVVSILSRSDKRNGHRRGEKTKKTASTPTDHGKTEVQDKETTMVLLLWKKYIKRLILFMFFLFLKSILACRIKAHGEVFCLYEIVDEGRRSGERL